MAEHTLSGGDKLSAYLADIAKRMGGGEVVVGFLENATYPDGTPVAAVAYWNEFGRNVESAEGNYYQLPRPFFRRMIANESPGWGVTMAKLAKLYKYDGERVLTAMGEDIRGALQQSINDFTTPGLADSTIKAKGFSKPLIHSGDMERAVDFEVRT